MTLPSSDSQTRPQRHHEIRRRRWLDNASCLSLLAALMLIFATGLFGLKGLREPTPAIARVVTSPTVAPTNAAHGTSGSTKPSATVLPEETATPMPSPTAAPTVTPGPPKVAIIAGHRGYDSGAICEGEPYDGLQEVHITTAVTKRLVRLLKMKGYETVDLDEYDQRLAGLQAHALLSIHVDSCVDWEGTTGYKVARARNSSIPEIEDRFVGCMNKEYGESTKLPRHDGSITHDMTFYHAFRQINPTTPAVIIELGFLYHDHDLLTEQQDVVAEGLLRGISCFVKEEQKAE